MLGVGGFGIVYQANDSLLRRTVAIKEYMPMYMAARSAGNTVSLRSATQLKDFESGKATFIDEARLLAQFKHPALIEVLRFWEENRTAYMVTPFYKGQTLNDYLRAAPESITEPALRRILLPLLDALAHMHAERVYHRDISPDNVMVLDNGSPILLDLGAARRLEELNSKAFTVLVKPGYAPIEQYAGEITGLQGAWTDLYGWAASAYFALTGKPPPPSASRVMRDTIIKLTDLKPIGYSQGFLAAIDATLAVRPDDRPQSVEALKELLALSPSVEVVEADSTDHAHKGALSAPSIPSELNDPNELFELTAIVDQPVEISPPITLTTTGIPDQLSVPEVVTTQVPAAPKPRFSSILGLIGVCMFCSLAAWWWMSRGGAPVPKPLPPMVQIILPQPRISGASTSSTPASNAPGLTGADTIAADAKAASTKQDDAKAADTQTLPVPEQTAQSLAVEKPAMTRLTIKPWGEVLVNGVQRGVSPPLKSLSLAPGAYNIELRNGDYPTKTMKVTLKAGQVLHIKHTFADLALPKTDPK